MKNIKRNMKKRAGFTLVELLIVIIIIGILAGAMLLVAGSGTDKAEATKIVSNLRGIKAATLLYYADNVGKTTPDEDDFLKDVSKYMDRDLSVDAGTVQYALKVVEADPDEPESVEEWWVEASEINQTGVQNKLAGMAKEAGLYAEAEQGDEDSYYTAAAKVYMRAR